MFPRRMILVLLYCLFALIPVSRIQSAALPPGFSEILVAQELSRPTTMQFAPDGRLFVAEQGGSLRVIKDGVLLPTPFLTVPVDSTGERGLLGIAFDPNFATNSYVYIYYTTSSAPIHNRVTRFTANGDVAEPGSEVPIFELDDLSSATNHNGGAIHFGPDGKLYIAAGENANTAYAQSFDTVLGKILRINPDGSIPTDNPFIAQTTGKNQSIWAYGLRNPFNFAFQPGTGLMYLNDVGQSTWEEVNEGQAGANYGWPATEGFTTDPNFQSPVYAYGHGSDENTGCSIVGATFYNPLVARFPADYVGDYFFGDLCSAWIKRIDPVTKAVQPFATSAGSSLVDIKASADGYLYYLARGGGNTTGVVYRVDYTVDQSGWIAPTGTVTDTIGNPTYSWAVIPGATAYDLFVGATDSVGNIIGTVFFGRVNNPSCDSTTCSVELTLVNPAAWVYNGTYVVYLQAADSGSWQGPYTFAVQATAPTAPTLIAPSFANPLQPTLNWTLDADSGRAAFFQLYLAPTENLFTPLLPLPTWISRLDACGAWDGTTCSLTVPGILADNIYYSLYMQSWGAGGFSTGGAIPGADGWVYQEFATGTPPPKLATNLQAQVSGNVPTFSWTAPAFATAYELWVGTVVNGVANQAHYNTHPAANLGCDGGGQCSITLTSTVFQVGQYQWFVRATGPAGVSTYGPTLGWAVPEPPTFTIN